MRKKRRQQQQLHEEAKHQDDAPTQTIHSELDTDNKELMHAVKSQNSNKILHEFKKHLGQKEAFDTIRQLVHHSGVVTSNAPSTTELQAQCKRLREEKDSWKTDEQVKEQQIKHLQCMNIDTSDSYQAHKEVMKRLQNAFNVEDDNDTLRAMSTLILNRRLSQ